MAITQESGIIKKLYGLSTDTKPTDNIPQGSTFWELDTKKEYVFAGEEWYAKA